MLGKSPVTRYLDEVLKVMVADSGHLDPRQLSGAPADAGYLAAVLAGAVGHRVIAAVVAAGHPSPASSRRDRRAENLLGEILRRAQQLAVTWGLSWSDITADALGQAEQYVAKSGGDVRYEFERGLPENVVQVRWMAARDVLPGAVEAATGELFWSIIGPEFGAQPHLAEKRGAALVEDRADLQVLGRTVEELRSDTATVEDRLQFMGLTAAPAQDPWRQIVEGPSFLAYPTRLRTDPQMHYGDEYQLRLTNALDTTGPWLPRPILDAAARGQITRLLFMMESTQLEDRYRLLEVSPEDVTAFANDLYRTSLSLLDGGDLPSRMTHGQINELAARMSFAAYDLLKVRATNPVVEVADHVVCGAGSLVLFEEVETSFTERSERPAYAAFALALAVHLWIASPFRGAVTSFDTSTLE